MGRRGICGAAGLLVALVLSVAATARAAGPAEGTAVDVAGLASGPEITDAGLVWLGSQGIELLPGHGVDSKLLVAQGRLGGPEADEALFAAQWWSLRTPGAVLGGAVDGSLHVLPLEEACVPPAGPADGSLLAVSGSRLYAALSPSCLGHAEDPWQLVVISLRDRRMRRLGALPGTPQALAAAGDMLAITYERAEGQVVEPSRRPRVRVLDAHSGRTLWELRLPAGVYDDGGLQVDARGDVLGGAARLGVMSAFSAALAHPPFLRPQPPWWAPPHARTARVLRVGGEAALSDGRIASRTEVSAGGAIDLTDLATGATRTAVTFEGTIGPLHVALSGNELAWSQRRTVVVGARRTPCQIVDVAPPQLASVDLRTLPPTPIVVAAPPQPALECFFEPEP